MGLESDYLTIIMVVKILLHAVAILGGITISGMMYTYYMKSTQENGAAKATVYNFAVNYLGSIIFGFAFFNEIVT